MKKALFTLGFAAISAIVLAGGIVTNTNQSASFIRMPAQDATLGIEAVYYNPAGISFLRDGFHLSVNNQYIKQTRTIGNSYLPANTKEFVGGVTAPLFPSLYGVYKKNKLAFALSVNPIGGGGSAAFEDGLPSLENQPATLPRSLTAAGVTTTKYSMDVDFQAKSIIWGVQGTAAYQVNDQLSVAVGLRYLSISNSYNGYLKNIQINPNFPAAGFTGNMVKATDFFTTFSAYLSNLSTVLAGTGTSLQPIINAGGGGVLLSNGTAAGLTAAQISQLQGTITSLGGSPANMTIAQAKAFFDGASASYAANATAMTNNANGTKDKELDAEQTGSGFVPIIGVNFKVSDQVNIGLKYEHRASMNVVNNTTKDDVNLFPDGAETPNDMPSMLAAGISVQATDNLKLHGGYHMYLDRQADYGKKVGGSFVENKVVIDKNLWEAAGGLEYTLFDKFVLSLGYLRTQTGVNSMYQSDQSHSLSTNSLGGGIKYIHNDKLSINLGGMNTWYIQDFKTAAVPFGTGKEYYQETYNRSASVIALGIEYSF